MGTIRGWVEPPRYCQRGHSKNCASPAEHGTVLAMPTADWRTVFPAKRCLFLARNWENGLMVANFGGDGVPLMPSLLPSTVGNDRVKPARGAPYLRMVRTGEGAFFDSPDLSVPKSHSVEVPFPTRPNQR